MIVVAAVAGLALVVFLCVLAGGTYFASRSILDPKQSTAASGGTTNAIPTGGPISTPLQSIEGYPEDVPFLKDNNGDLSTSVSQDWQAFSFSSNLPLAELTDFYLNGMKNNGWEIVNEFTQSNSKTYYFSKDPQRMVMISLTTTERYTMIGVMIPLVK